MSGLCDLWCGVEDLTEPCSDDAELQEAMIEVASLVCFRLGGGRWPGICTDTVQPASDCVCDVIAMPVRGGVGRAGSGRLLRLPQTPVVSITEVVIDGDVLDPAAYVIVDDESIVRIDGGAWPRNLGVHVQPPHLEVTYEYGALPSELGRRAAAMLATELLLAHCGSDTCRLDRRVVSIVREGVTIDTAAMPGLVEALVQGYIGVPEVDLFAATENPSKLRREGRLVVPGDPSLYDHRVR